MRRHWLRYDIWICLALSCVISLLPAKIAETILAGTYETYVEEHTVAEGEIGGAAGDDIWRAQNVEELLSHPVFTVVSPGIEYCNRGAGYYGGHYMYALTLPSGERVAACINMDSVQHSGETIYDGEAVLPVGQIVYEDLTQSENFLEQIEHSQKLTRTDFYVDMLGEGGTMGEEDYSDMPVTVTRVLSVVILFPILHMLGAKLGVFPYFFAPRKEKKQEWE